MAPATPIAPSQRRGVHKRLAILDAAAVVFAESGYERAAIDAIAARAGVSKPTVYSHFGSKEALFRESVAASAEQINASTVLALREWNPQADDWRAGLSVLAAQLVTCQRSPCAVSLNRQIHAEVARDPGIFHTVRERAAVPVIEGLAGRLAMLGNAGHLDIADPVLAAKQFLALIGAELPDLTELGTQAVSDVRVSQAVDDGVATFVRAYARHHPEPASTQN